jgi:hypothetical protein
MLSHLGNRDNFIAGRPSAAVSAGPPAPGNLMPHPILNPKTQKNNYRYTPSPGPRSIPSPDSTRTCEPAGRRLNAPGSHNAC